MTLAPFERRGPGLSEAIEKTVMPYLKLRESRMIRSRIFLLVPVFFRLVFGHAGIFPLQCWLRRERVALKHLHSSFPLIVSINRRYFHGQKNVPFPVLGSTACFTSLSALDHWTFIDDTVANRYSTLFGGGVPHSPAYADFSSSQSSC
jgi:hypothetical protein